MKSLVPKFLRKTSAVKSVVAESLVAPSAPSMSEEELFLESLIKGQQQSRKKAMDWMMQAIQTCNLGPDTFMRAARVFGLIKEVVGVDSNDYVVASAALTLTVKILNLEGVDRLFRTPDTSIEEVQDMMGIADGLIDDVAIEATRDTAFDHIHVMATAAGLKKPKQEFIIYARYICELFAIAGSITEIEPKVLAAAAVKSTFTKMGKQVCKKWQASMGPEYQATSMQMAIQCSSLKSKPLHAKYSKLIKAAKEAHKKACKGRHCNDDHPDSAVMWSMVGLVALLDMLISV